MLFVNKAYQDYPKNKVVSAIEKDYLSEIIMKLGIRPNCSDYLWSQTKLADYPKVSDNIQDKAKRLLSLQKFTQIRTNPKVRSYPRGLSFYEVTQCERVKML